MSAAGYPAGYTIDAIGFMIAIEGVGTQTGTLKIWFKNTNDTTYTLGNNWTITGFTHVCTYESFTVPIGVGTYSIPFNDSIFTYTGGGVYVAWEFTNPTLIGGTVPLVAYCNVSHTDLLRGYESSTELPTVLVLSAFRPASFFTNNSFSGIKDSKQGLASIKIFPVPNNGKFTLTISSLNKDTYSIRIFNDIGIEIYSKKEIEITGSVGLYIDLGSNRSGVYNLLCESKANNIVEKFIIR
jgi:hypothetical protein